MATGSTPNTSGSGGSGTNSTTIPPPAAVQKDPATGSTTLTPAVTYDSNFKLTDGWYVTIACVGGVLLADTRFGFVAFSLLGLALIYQLTLLVQGK